jgi:hypothetical protein
VTPESGDEADDDQPASEKWTGDEGEDEEADDDRPASEKWTGDEGEHEEKLDDDRRRISGPSAVEKWTGDEGEHEEKLDDDRRRISGPSAVSASSEDIVFDDEDGSDGHDIRSKSLSEQCKEEGNADSQSGSGPHRSPRLTRGSSERLGNDEDSKDHMDDNIIDEGDDSDSESSQNAESFLWKARMQCGKVVNNETVQLTIISLILLNALMMGIATFDFVTESPTVHNIFTKIDKGFLVVFTIEVSMQLFYLGLTLFADGWLVFDLLIVVFSWSFESLQIIRAFRIFRAFRLITRVKPLRDLVLAIGAVLPRMYAIASLLMIIFYIFSVLFTELFSDLPLSDNYFGTLDASLFTCMEMMTLEWGEIAREVMTYRQWAWAPFTAFILITGFIVFNLIVAVVCDAVAVTEKVVREMDGFDSDDPNKKLDEAQERIDLLQCHISDMLRTQEAVQVMIEIMAGELLHLEAEKMKAEHREAELRIEMERRNTYTKSMESREQVDSLARNYVMEKGRRESEKRLKEVKRRESTQNTTEQLNSPVSSGKAKRRGSAGALGSFAAGEKSPRRRGARPSFGRDLSSHSSSRGSSRGSMRGSISNLTIDSPRGGLSGHGSSHGRLSGLGSSHGRLSGLGSSHGGRNMLDDA